MWLIITKKKVTGNTSVEKLMQLMKKVVSLLKNRGLYLEISELNLMDKDIKMGAGKKVPLKELSIFCKKFYT